MTITTKGQQALRLAYRLETQDKRYITSDDIAGATGAALVNKGYFERTQVRDARGYGYTQAYRLTPDGMRAAKELLS